jgi:hypothetical protein
MNCAPSLAGDEAPSQPFAQKRARSQKTEEVEAKDESAERAAFRLARKRKPGLY